MSREIFLVNACDGVTTQLTADGMVKGGNAGIRKRCGRNKHFRKPLSGRTYTQPQVTRLMPNPALLCGILTKY